MVCDLSWIVKFSAARCIASVFALTLIVFVAGCELHDELAESPFEQETCDYVLLVAIDAKYVHENLKAYDFICYACDKYFQARIGNEDQIIISQISGDGDRPLLWQGTPRTLRQDFPDRESFRQFLISHAAPGKQLNQGVANSLRYLQRTHSVASGKAKSVALILSDMKDESTTPDDVLVDSVVKFSKGAGHIGFYFCDQVRMRDLETKLEAKGLHMVTIEADFNGRPHLPNFEN